MTNPLSDTARAVIDAEEAALKGKGTPAPEPADDFEPFDIYCRDASGINIALPHAGIALSTPVKTLFPGDEQHITREIVDANRDTFGNSWLTLDENGQRALWGKVRFGRVGDSRHLDVLHDAAVAKRDAAVAERRTYMQSNPRIAKATGSVARADAMAERIRELNAAIRESEGR